MKRNLIFIAMLVCSLSASAQLSHILGHWMTVDDKTGDNYAVVRGSLDKFGVLGRNQTWIRAK